jgi:hypothetical protein
MRMSAIHNQSTQARRLRERLIPINTSFPKPARWKRRVPMDFPQEQYMKFPLWRRRREEELEEEIQSHLQMAIRDRIDRCQSADEAELAARREFGNLGLIKETTRGRRACPGVDGGPRVENSIVWSGKRRCDCVYGCSGIDARDRLAGRTRAGSESGTRRSRGHAAWRLRSSCGNQCWDAPAIVTQRRPNYSFSQLP